MKKSTLFFQKIFKTTKYLKGQKKYKMGARSYIAENSKITNKDTTIGKFCTIAGECYIGAGRKKLDRLSLHGFQWCESNERLWGDLKTPKENLVESLPPNRPVTIGNDVWIGFRSVIVEGIKVGDGAVVGACSVVTHDVPPYSVVVGAPARVVKYRFPQEIINKLEELKWWDYPEDFIVRLPFDDINACINKLEENKHLRITNTP